MDPETRVDLFISYYGGSETLSSGFETHELAFATEKAVLVHANNRGNFPSIFFKRTTGDVIATINALLQTRAGGVALILLTPMFMREPSCLAELRAVLEVHSHRNVFLKLLCVRLGCSKDDILSSPLVQTQVPSLHECDVQTVIPITNMQETSARLSKVVADAWECKEDLSPESLPTILGRTRDVTFLALQRVFVKEDLPVFSAILDLPTFENVQQAFRKASENGSVTQYNVNKLYDVIIYRISPRGEEQRRMVNAYERKWGHSDPLEWGDGLKQNLLQLSENKQSGGTPGSSSARFPRHLSETQSDVQEVSTSFKPYFDKPPQSCNIVLNFDGRDENGNPVTPEGRLLRKVLEPLHNHLTVSACGKQTKAIHGMGGVGKTTALRALCCHQQVRDAYQDGVCFLEFGQDANDQKVMKQVAQCVRKFGGRKEAQEIEKSDSLSDVIEKGAVWLRNKTVLLVCDDLWSNNKNEFGYVKDLKQLLREAPRSCLVISTRDRNIEGYTHEPVEFASLQSEGRKAREILLAGVSNAGIGADIFNKEAEDKILHILRICAGLPLALAIAGRGLAKSLRDTKTVSNGVRQYCNILEQDIGRITNEEYENYPGLARVIESSLRQCREWSTSDKMQQLYGQLDIEDMFKALCVFEKQMVMPKRALQRLWRTDEKCTNAMMEMFADLNLANRVESGLSTEQEFGLRLHDLVLLRCQQIAGDERSSWHKRIVEAYREKLDDKNYEDGQQAEKTQAWWNAEDDGYVYKHLSRHLVLSGLAHELHSLLCDIRWTLRRMEVGGWVSLNVDFERLNGAHEHAGSGISKIHEVLKNSLPYARERLNLLAFYIFAHLSREERKKKPVSEFLESIHRHFPKPWLLPVNRCIGAIDKREIWSAPFTFDKSVLPTGLTVNWKKGTVFIATEYEIVVWCTNEQRILRKSPNSYSPCTASSADGQLIVSGHFKAVQRLNGESGSRLGDLLCGHTKKVRCIAVGADGKLIVSGSVDNTLRLWNGESGLPIGVPLRGHESKVACVAVSADGKIVVSGSADRTVRLWNGESGLPIGDALRGHEEMVMGVAVSADGKVAVSGSVDKTVRLWNVKTGLPIGDPLRGHEGIVRCVAISGDGKVVVSGSDDKTLRLWNGETGLPIGDPLRGHEGEVMEVAVSADGRKAVSVSSDNTVRGWGFENDIQPVKPIQGHRNYHEGRVCCIAVSADQKVIVTGSVDKTIRLWNGESGSPIGGPLHGHAATVNSVAVNADGKLAVSGSDDKTVRLWNGESGLPIGGPLSGHSHRVTCVAVSADGKIVVSGSVDETIRLWNGESGLPISDLLYVKEGIVHCAAVSADGNVIAFGSADKKIFGGKMCSTKVSFESKTFVRTEYYKEEKSESNVDETENSESRSTVDDHIIYSLTNAKCVAISADAKVIVAGCKSGEVQRWDVESGSLSGDLLCEYGSEGLGVRCVAVSADGKVVTSGSYDKAIRLTDEGTCTHSTTSGQCRRSVLEDFEYLVPHISCLATDSDGRFLVIGSASGVIVICRWVE